MKLLLVAIVLSVACMIAPLLAAPLQEEEAQAVLQAIQILLSSAKHGRGEVQQSENATSMSPGKPPECYQ